MVKTHLMDACLHLDILQSMLCHPRTLYSHVLTPTASSGTAKQSVALG